MDQERDILGKLGAQEIAGRIYEIGLLASQNGDLDDVIRAICTRLLEVTGAQYAGIGLVSDTGDTLEHRAGCFTDGSDVNSGYRHAIGEGVTGQVAASGEAVCIKDVSKDPRYKHLISQTRSELAVPLTFGGRVLGVLNLESAQVDRFGAPTLALMQALASPVVLAIQNAFLLDEQRKRFEQLQKLSRVSEVITSTVDLELLLHKTVDSIRYNFCYDLVSLGLVSDDGDLVVLRAMSTDIEVSLSPGHSQPLGLGVTGHVVKTGQSVKLADVSTFPGHVSTGLGLGSEMCSPLRVADEVFGFVDVESRLKNDFDDSDLIVLETVADHIAPAIENARNLKRNQERREDVYGMLVHDLRNPLTVIGSSIDLLDHQMKRVHDTPSDDVLSSRRKLNHARAACDQMLVMIDGMLELHRIETGEMTVLRKPTDCSDLVRNVVRTMSAVAEAERIEMTVDAQEDLSRILVDVSLLTRVLENLVVNSLKFTPAGGKLDLAVGEAPSTLVEQRLPSVGRCLLLTVSDTGRGIPAEDHERVFDRFAVVESRREGRKYSTGLGLAFCKQAIAAHGGAIWVESQPGSGSRFHVLLPVD